MAEITDYLQTIYKTPANLQKLASQLEFDFLSSANFFQEVENHLFHLRCFIVYIF